MQNQIKIIIFIFLTSLSLATGFTQTQYLETRLRDNGDVTAWLVLGPFSNSDPNQPPALAHGTGCFGFHQDLLSNEATVQPCLGESATTIADQTAEWRLHLSRSAWVDLNSLFLPNDDVVAYAFTILHAGTELQAKLGLVHNDGMKLWLNGRLVYDYHPSQLDAGLVSVPVTLQAGENRILAKIEEKVGGWGFGLNVTTTPKSPLKIFLPVSEDTSLVQKSLFEIATLQNCEPIAGEALVFQIPFSGIKLPGVLKLPLEILDEDFQPVATTTLQIGQKPESEYPIDLKLPPAGLPYAGYTLKLANMETATKTIEFVAQKVFNSDPDSRVGERPYEMAGRPGCARPLVDFENLDGWWLHSKNGASARLYRSRVAQMDGQFVGRVIYHGETGASAFEFGPPQPLPIADELDAVGGWIFGNNWSWVPDPTTPQVEVQVILLDEQNREHPISLGTVGWEEWFLRWVRFFRPAGALRFKSLLVSGGSNSEDRELFFDSFYFNKEEWPALDPGPHPAEWPFLTTPETILPVPEKTVKIKSQLSGQHFKSVHTGTGAPLHFEYQPQTGTLADFKITRSGATIQPFVGGDLQFSATGERRLKQVSQSGDWTHFDWELTGANPVTYRISISPRHNSLLIDLVADQAIGLDLGYLESSVACKLVRVPMLTYGLPDPQVVCTGPLFVFALLDHYRSHASALFARNDVLAPNRVQFNGGCIYQTRTDGQRNPLRERIVLSASPDFHDVLPNIPHPPSTMGHLTGPRCWRQHWGLPSDSTAYDEFYQPLRELRQYGVSQFIVRHHEETWRDGGESFTLRLQAAPKKGGDTALKNYVQRVKDLGFICGLYTNYIDFATVNANWSPDRVARLPDGNFVRAWPRCYTLKPYLAWQFEAEYAPKIREKFGSNTVYCDVHTAVRPWERVDFDHRLPQAGMFQQQYQAYTRLLANEKHAYHGPVFSEGLYHWFYAGLTDGNYGQLRESNPDQMPPLVDFNLLRIHPLETGIGMGGPFMFYPAGVAPEERTAYSRKFNRFLATTIAYGHNGYLLDADWGLTAGLKSYYMMQQLQARYALQPVAQIAYFDGSQWMNTSDAIRRDVYQRGQIRTRYRNGTETVVNLATDTLAVRLGRHELRLPPDSYAAVGPDLFLFSGLWQGQMADFVQSPAYVYADGRGNWFKNNVIEIEKCAVVIQEQGTWWLIPIEPQAEIRLNLKALGLKKDAQPIGCDADGVPVAAAVSATTQNGWLTVKLDPQFFKYRIQ